MNLELNSVGHLGSFNMENLFQDLEICIIIYIYDSAPGNKITHW